MKYKTIEFAFPRELTADQEETLIAAFQALRDKARNKVKTARKQYDNPIYKRISGDMGTTVANALDFVILNFDKAILLHKPEKTTYRLEIAFEMFKAFDFKVGRFSFDYYKKFEDTFVGFFRKSLCRQIGFSPDDVSITFGETETP